MTDVLDKKTLLRSQTVKQDHVRINWRLWRFVLILALPVVIASLVVVALLYKPRPDRVMPRYAGRLVFSGTWKSDGDRMVTRRVRTFYPNGVCILTDWTAKGSSTIIQHWVVSGGELFMDGGEDEWFTDGAHLYLQPAGDRSAGVYHR